MNIKKIIFPFLAISYFLLATTPTALAVGVGVTPAQLHIDAHAGQESVARIKVTNPSKDVTLFEVYPDDLEAVVSVSPASFTLESKEEKYVDVKVTSPEAGQFLTTLSVVGRLMADSKFQAGSGVKIPVTITVDDASTYGMANVLQILGGNSWVGLGALIILLGSGVFYASRWWFGRRVQR